MGGGSRIVAIVACATALCAAQRVRADAFMEKAGEGKAILTATFDTADRYWTADGRLIPVASYRKFNLSALGAYGYDASTTLIARVDAGHLKDMRGGEAQASGAAGVRRLLFESGAMRVAVQALASAGAGLDGMPGRSSGAALDVRIAGAVTFDVMTRPAFVEMSAGPRVVIGDARGMRLDVTFGVRPAEKWLLLLQNFNRFNEPGPLGGRTRAHKAQASVMYDVTEQWSAMAGVFATVAARAERRQYGALTGVMRRF
jgi:hypothetical protein